jgi:hypothetical protein
VTAVVKVPIEKVPVEKVPVEKTSFLLAYEDGTECSETLPFKLQTPGNNPEESTRHSNQGRSLKSRTQCCFSIANIVTRTLHNITL